MKYSHMHSTDAPDSLEAYHCLSPAITDTGTNTNTSTSTTTTTITTEATLTQNTTLSMCIVAISSSSLRQ